MKSLYQRISIASIVLFIVGITVVAYFQYTTPDRILTELGVSDPRQVTLVRQAVLPAAVLTGLEIAVGLVAVLLLVYQQRVSNPTTGGEKLEFKHNADQKQELTDEEQVVQVRLQPVEALMGQPFPKPEIFFEKVLSLACKELEASQAALYVATTHNDKRLIRLVSGYALSLPESQTLVYEFGEGLAGQVAKEGKSINVSNVPQGYITVLSGLGSASPNTLAIVPVQLANQVVGVLEIASFRQFSRSDENYLQALAGTLGERLSRQAEVKMPALQE
jgi:putative methionine-R-sulfoxide reductase with GAF domain